MADKSFGVDQLDILGTGTPTISAPNQLNLDCNTVAISTSATVGQNLTVSANAGISSLNVTGIATVVNFNATGISTIAVPSNTNANSALLVTANGSSAYRFTGPGQDGSDDNPNIYLVRGQRYIFTNNSGGSHPFQIRVANGGAAYTDGVTYSNTGNNTTTDGNNLIINLQHDAPARLFYQCTAHGGMVGNIYTVGGPQVISGVVTATSFSGDGSNLTGISAGTSLSGSTNNTVCTVTGANAIQGEANLTFDGTNLDLGDGKYVRLGSGNDFQMWHNGGTGNTNIQQVSGHMYFYTGSDLNMLIQDGTSVDLYYANSKKFETTSAGVTVTGSIRSTGNSNFGDSAASPSPSALTVKMATNKHIGFSPSQSEVGDVPALVAFQDNGSLASIGFRGDDVRFAAGSTEVIRITSDGRIGINQSSPNNYELDIWNRSSADDAQIRLHNRGTGSGQHTIMRFSIAGTSASNYIYFGDSGDSNAGQIRYNHGNNAMTFHTNGTLQMQIRSSGAVQKPNNPIFFAYMDAQASHNSGDALKLDHTELNVGSGYNTSNYKFTPPVDGHYMFHAAANFSLGNGEFTRAANVRLYKNGSALTYQIGRNSLTGYQSSYPSTDGTFMVYGTTSDEFTCVVSWETGGGNFSNLNSSETLHPHGTKFMGYLIG